MKSPFLRPSSSFPARFPLTVAAGALLLLSTASGADVVTLIDGLEQRGRVVELGGNAIELHIRSGTSRRIRLKDIRKAVFDPARDLTGEKDMVIRKNGTEIAGEVKYSEDGKSIIISQADGSEVEIVRDQVARIVARGQGGPDSAAVYSAALRDEIHEAIKALETPGEEAARAEERLKTCGIFAIFDVEAALKKAKPGSASAKALSRVQKLYRIKQLTPDSLQEIKDFYRIISSGKPEEKQHLLVEMFTIHVSDSVPLAKAIVLDTDEDPGVRAFTVALLGKNNFNRDLVDIYNNPAGGQVQFAAGVALARNRILVGAESLIQGLDLDRRELRELAIKTLKEATGKDMGYNVNDTPAARRVAVDRWRKWWTQSQAAIEAQTSSILSGRTAQEETPERKKAIKLWGEGCALLDEKKYEAAEARLRTAVLSDPTFVNARVSLGVTLALHRGKGEEGRRLLEDVLQETDSEASGGLGWIHFYLGRAWEAAGDFERADLEFRAANDADPKFFRAAIALADMKFRRATAPEGKEKGEIDRRALLSEAAGLFRTAIERIDVTLSSVEVLSVQDLPPETPPAFERQAHNQSVRELKANLRLAKSDSLFSLAKIWALLEDRQKAQASLETAIENLSDDREGGARRLLAEMHNYRGALYEEAGEPGRALREYRTVVKADLDPENATALEAIRRLEAAGREPAAGRSRRRKAAEGDPPPAERSPRSTAKD